MKNSYIVGASEDGWQTVSKVVPDKQKNKQKKSGACGDGSDHSNIDATQTDYEFTLPESYIGNECFRISIPSIPQARFIFFKELWLIDHQTGHNSAGSISMK